MSFFAELRQRNVLKVATAYAVVSWLIIQVMDTVAPALHLPLWTVSLVTVLLLIGFPVALLLAWAFEMTPEGIKREREVDRAAATSQNTGRKLDFVIIAVLAVALVYFVADKFLMSSGDARDEADLTVAASGQSIAVLPFENRSALESDQYFTDGIHDDLLTQISRIPDIKTISRTSVLAYRDTTKNMRQIGQELGVATLLEGGVQRAGDQVRINVQLIDVASDAHVWAETYTRNMTAENIFAIQTEITLAIAEALRSVLSPEARQQMEDDLPTENLAALEAYFRGKVQADRHTSEGYDLAIDEFKRAIAADEEFALAHAWLANSYLLQIYFSGRSQEQQVALAQPHIDRAMAIDPDLPKAWNALGNLYKYQFNTEDATRAYERLLELDPNNAMGYQDFGNFNRWYTWDLPAAERLFARAMELDPKSTGIIKEYAESLLAMNEVEGAISLLTRLTSEHSELPGGFHVMGVYKRSFLHRYDQAIAQFRRAFALDPLNPDIAVQLAFAYRSVGDPDETVFWAERAAALSRGGANEPAYLGIAAYAQGDTATARRNFESMAPVAAQYFTALFYLHELDLKRGGGEASADRWSAWWPVMNLDFDDFGQLEALLSTYSIEALAAAGREADARQMAEKALPVMRGMPRVGTVGVGTLDARIHYAIGEDEAAIGAFREYVDAGGAEFDQMQDGFLANLRKEPEMVRLVAIVAQRLADQRANLIAMEAAGQLAPIPSLPGSEPGRRR